MIKQLSILFYCGAAYAQMIAPGRVIQSNTDAFSVEPGERVTSYLSSYPYILNLRSSCPQCPGLPTLLSYSLVCAAVNVGATVSVAVLSYDGLPGITFVTTLLTATEGSTFATIPRSAAAQGNFNLDASMQGLLFSRAPLRLFRVDLTNTSANQISIISASVGLTALTTPLTNAFTLAASFVVPKPFQVVPF